MPRPIERAATKNGTAVKNGKGRTKSKPKPAEPAPDPGARSGPPLWESAPADRIAPGLADLAVPIESLVPDPDNARVHGERNMFALKDSLALYGQLKPVVVREETGVVMAGNGTLRAATELGWTVLAASVVSMTDDDAVGYSLADNRTAELAEWNYEVVARLSKLQEECGAGTVGWTADELAALRGEMPEQRWEDVWQGMPEFANQDMTPAKQVIVNLKSEEDVQKLFKLLGYTGKGDWVGLARTRQRPSVWWPRQAMLKAGVCES